MKRLAAVAAVLGGATLAPSAFAQETGAYWSVGYTHIAVEVDGADDANVGAIQGKLGYRFHPNFGVEGEAAFGVVDESYDVFGTDVDVGLDKEFGLFAVGFIPVSPEVNLFARAGYVDVEIEASAGGMSLSDGDNGTGYGAGLIWNLGMLDLRAEYTRYDVEGEANTFSVSVGGKF